MSRKFVAVLLGLSSAAAVSPALAQAQAQAGSYCYTLLDRSGRLVSQSATSPVDLSRRIGDVLAEQHPGHHLVFGLAESCPAVSAPPRPAAGRGAGRASAAAQAASTELLLGRYPDVGGRSDGSARTDGGPVSGQGESAASRIRGPR